MAARRTAGQAATGTATSGAAESRTSRTASGATASDTSGAAPAKSLAAMFTGRSLAKNPVRTAVTVVGVVLATALILAVSTSALSLYNFLAGAEVAKSGSFNAAVMGATAEEARGLDGAAGVTGAASAQVEGYSKLDQSSYLTPYLCVMGIDGAEGAAEKFADLVSLRVTEGSLPSSDSEILLPQTLVDAGVLDAAVGDEIALEVGQRHALPASGLDTSEVLDQRTLTLVDEQGDLVETLEDLQTRTFTVCGLYAGNEALYNTLTGTVDPAGIPALTRSDLAGASGVEGGSWITLVTVTDPIDASSIIAMSGVLGGGTDGGGSASDSSDGSTDGGSSSSSAGGSDGGSSGGSDGVSVLGSLSGGGPAGGSQPTTVRTNDYVNRLTSFSFSFAAYRTLGMLAGLITGVVVVCSVMFIRNSFAIAVNERIRQFGLLASIGATKRQIRDIVLRESLMVAAVGIPLGILLGYAGTAAVLTLCEPMLRGFIFGIVSDAESVYNVPLNCVLSVPTVLITAALALATVLLSAWGPARQAGSIPPVEAIRPAFDARAEQGGKDVRRCGRVAGRLFGVEGAVAAKSFRRDARRRRATMGALVCGAVLMTTSFLFGDYLSLLFKSMGEETAKAYDITYHYTEDRISASEGERAATDQIAEGLASCDGVEQSVQTLEVYCWVAGDSSADGEGSTDGAAGGATGGVTGGATAGSTGGATGNSTEGPLAGRFVYVMFLPDDEFASWVSGQGLDPADFADPSNPHAVGVNIVRTNDGQRYGLDQSLFDGGARELDIECEVVRGGALDETGGAANATGDSIATGATGGSDAAGTADATGETNETSETLGSMSAYNGYVSGTHTIHVRVDATVDEPTWFMGTPSVPVVAMPLSMAASVDEALADPSLSAQWLNRTWRVNVNSSDPSQTEESMRAVLRSYGLSDSRLYNLTSSTSAATAIFQTARVFIFAFAAIVSLIAVTGAFNTAYTSVSLRRREFAALRSVGCTRRGLAKMLGCECLMYGLHVLAWSFPVSCLVSLALRAAIGSSLAGAPFIVPWETLPTALLATLVIALASLHSVRKVNADNPVEVLREEAI